MKIVQNQLPSYLPDGKLKLAIIGQSPGEEELESGIPFTGRAGRELDRWLAALRIVRGHCFVGNICQERPPQNKISFWFEDKNCTIPNDKVRGWIEVLREQLMELRPHCIITLGNEATYALTGKLGVGNYAGSILPCTLVPGLKVVPNYHPSYIIRGKFILRSLVLTFLNRAKEESEYPDIRLPKREYVVDPTKEEVFFHLSRLMQSPKVAFDIENPKPYKDITCISFADSPNWAISIPFTKGRNHRWSLDVEAEVWREVSRLLAGPALKIGHNILSYDFAVLWKKGVYVAPPYWDTMVANNRLYPDLTHKSVKADKLNRLQVCTAIYTREPYYKTDYKNENKSDPTWKGSDVEFWLYNAKDSVVAYEIYERQYDDFQKFGSAIPSGTI